MSGPNDSYDPKEVAALSDAELDARRRGRPRRLRRPPTDLDALAAAHTAHLGIAFAGRAGAPRARRAAAAGPGRRRSPGQRGAGRAHRGVRRPAGRRSSAERDERVLVEEAVDVTLPLGPDAAAAAGTR